MSRYKTQSGNAIFLILVAVALFGALAYTFMKGARSTSGNMSPQQAKIAAQDILDYAQTVENGVNKLRSKGCSEGDLNFNHSLPPGAQETNPSAPADGSCDVFGPNGANISPPTPPSNWYVSEAMGTDWIGSNYYWYTGSESYQDIGTSCASASCGDLALNLWDITKDICDAINNQLGYNFTTIPVDTGSHCWGAFQGTFKCGGGGIRQRFNTPDLKGKMSVCFKDPAYQGYVFNHILLAR